jgi:hypothetical protein
MKIGPTFTTAEDGVSTAMRIAASPDISAENAHSAVIAHDVLARVASCRTRRRFRFRTRHITSVETEHGASSATVDVEEVADG